jgi:sulfur relay protein TusD/DsrE
MMNILVIVNHNPLESSLVEMARRFVETALKTGHRVPAVFFHNDGVYNALETEDVADSCPQQWVELCKQNDLQLLLCSTASFLRFDEHSKARISRSFSPAGLAQMWDFAARCDRVVTF